MQTTLRSTLIVGATALFAVFATAQAAEPYDGGFNSLRSFLNENLNDVSRAESNGEFRDDVTSVRSLVRGFIKDVGAKPAKRK